MTKAGDIMMLAGMFLIFIYAGTFGFKELVADQSWAIEMSSQNLLVPAGNLAIWRGSRKVSTIAIK